MVKRLRKSQKEGDERGKIGEAFLWEIGKNGLAAMVKIEE